MPASSRGVVAVFLRFERPEPVSSVRAARRCCGARRPLFHFYCFHEHNQYNVSRWPNESVGTYRRLECIGPRRESLVSGFCRRRGFESEKLVCPASMFAEGNRHQNAMFFDDHPRRLVPRRSRADENSGAEASLDPRNIPKLLESGISYCGISYCGKLPSALLEQVVHARNDECGTLAS